MERRKRDLNPRAGFPAYTLSRGASSASWVFLRIDMNSLKQEFVEVHYMEPIMPDQYMGMKTSEIAHLVHNKIQEEINKNVAEKPLTM